MSYKGSTWKSKPKEKNIEKLKTFLKRIQKFKITNNGDTI